MEVSDKTPRRRKVPTRHPPGGTPKSLLKRHAVIGGDLKGPDLRKNVAANMRRIRSDLALTQLEISENLGISLGYVGALERAEQNITLDSLSNLATAYGMTVPEIISPPATQPNSKRPFMLRDLVRITRSIADRVQDMLVHEGDAVVSNELLATVASALMDVLLNPSKYKSA